MLIEKQPQRDTKLRKVVLTFLLKNCTTFLEFQLTTVRVFTNNYLFLLQMVSTTLSNILSTIYSASHFAIICIIDSTTVLSCHSRNQYLEKERHLVNIHAKFYLKDKGLSPIRQQQVNGVGYWHQNVSFLSSESSLHQMYR